MLQSKRKKKMGDALVYLGLIALSIFSLFPFIWQLMSSMKTSVDLTKHSDKLLPTSFTLKNYANVFNNFGFLKFMGNSFVVSFMAMAVSMVLASLAAYSIVRFFPKLGSAITRTLIIAYMFPPILLAVPYFIVISSIGLANTLTGLIFTYLSFTVPFCIWLLTGYIRTIPIDIEEAARIDGASRWKTFYKVSLPLAAPGIVATSIFAFINAWNEFLFSLVLISSGSKKTVSVALYSLTGGETLQHGDMLAASVMVVLPTLILFIFIQRHLAYGLTGGAVK